MGSLCGSLLVKWLIVAISLLHGAAAASNVNVTAYGRVEVASDSATVSGHIGWKLLLYACQQII